MDMTGIHLLEFLYEGKIDEAEALFQESGKSPLDITPKENWTWLHKILSGFEYVPRVTIQYFLNKGVEVNAQDGYGMTPLHYAMRSKNPDAALVLLEAGADPNIPNERNIIPLTMIGGMPDRLDILEKMLKQGGNVHHLNGRNATRTVLESYFPEEGEDDIKAIYEMMLRYA